jgi:ribosomal protein S18 acetylase RimI-like enzyme
LAPIAIGKFGHADDIGVVRSLFQRHAGALPFDLGFQNFAAELAGLPAPYCPPDGALLIASKEAAVVGVVGIKRLAPGVAEIKRLYIAPEARGQGIGQSLLGRALDEARLLGYHSVRLDSHRPTMAAAIALYRRLGFREIPPYGPDMGGEIVFFEKDLEEY